MHISSTLKFTINTYVYIYIYQLRYHEVALLKRWDLHSTNQGMWVQPTGLPVENVVLQMIKLPSLLGGNSWVSPWIRGSKMIHLWQKLMHFLMHQETLRISISFWMLFLALRVSSTLAVFVNLGGWENRELVKVVSIPSFWLLVTPAALRGDLPLWKEQSGVQRTQRVDQLIALARLLPLHRGFFCCTFLSEWLFLDGGDFFCRIFFFKTR